MRALANLLASPRFRHFSLVVLVTLLVSVLSLRVMGSLIINSNYGEDWRDGLQLSHMLDGSGELPFVTRALLPWTVNAIVKYSPEHLREAGDSLLAPPPKGQENNAEWHRHGYQRCVLLALETLVLFAYSGALWLLARQLFPGHMAIAWTAPVLSLLALPSMMLGAKLYDFPVLLFSTLLLWCMAARRRALFLILFALSCLNKETTILFTALYAAYGWRHEPWKTYGFMLLAQVALYAAIRAGLFYVYAANNGADFEDNFFSNAMAAVDTHQMPKVAALLALAWMVLWRWTEKPPLLKCCLVVMLPVLVVMYMLFGNVVSDEIRVFLEIYPALALLVTYTLTETWRAPLKA